MIVKKIPARPAGRDSTVERAGHARRLVDYLRAPEKDSAEKAYMVAYMLGQKLGDTVGERLFHIGGRGFVSTTFEGQRAEMISVANEARRSPNPVDHWLLSWREGEQPTAKQVDAVVAMFTAHLGVAKQPCIYACHGDTHNRHVHIALNRYDAVARRTVEINDGWSIEAAHQAVALVVERFEWKAETDARYEVVNGRAVLSASAKARIEEGRPAIRLKAAAFENRTGYRSAQRIAQDEAVPLIAAATTWAELHAGLALQGMSYEPIGTNGVTIGVGSERVKASFVAPAITRTRLEKRLGQFQPRDSAVVMIPRRDDRDRFPEAFRADEYKVECDNWRRWQEGKKKAALVGRQPVASEPNSAIEASPIRVHAPKPSKPPPDLESFYYAKQEGEMAKRWRERHRLIGMPTLEGDQRGSGDRPQAIDGYQPYACLEGTRYARGPNDTTAFIDRGQRVDVVASDDAALLAALKLAAVKFDGRVKLRGDLRFRERAFNLAEANGLAHILADADLIARRAPWRAPSPSPRPTTPARPRSSTMHASRPRRDHNDERSATDRDDSRTVVYESARRRTGLRSLRGPDGLRALPTFGVDDRQREADRLLLRVPRGDVRGRPQDNQVRSAGSAPSGTSVPVNEDIRAAGDATPKPAPADPRPTRKGGLLEQASALTPSGVPAVPKPAPAGLRSSRKGGLLDQASTLTPSGVPAVPKGPVRPDLPHSPPSRGKGS